MSQAANATTEPKPEHVDVLIVGAGVSGIGSAYHLKKRCPTKSFAILEARDAIGGTWDLFRYPGIRSDSDMYTFGFNFKPWTNPKAIADAPSILAYLNETIAENDLERHIRFGKRLVGADWDSAAGTWTVTLDTATGTQRMTCNFLHMCSGYYNYSKAHRPEFPGEQRFGGEIVHPQFWPEALDYAGKRVVVIGSGATAVTLIPNMADSADHVTMLQRSPTYMGSRPAEDKIANSLRRFLPAKAAYALVRWKNVLMGMYFYNLCKRNPEKVKQMLIDRVRDSFGEDSAVDIDTHFTPSYNPWDQRLCLVPDDDLFNAISAGKASVVTDTIASFTETGVELASGEHLDADIIVTATGLELQFMSDLSVAVDGEAVHFPDTMTYKGMMFSGVPNLAITMGYTNASWTLKSDLICGYLSRILKHMDKHGYSRAMPVLGSEPLPEDDYLDLTSGYVKRAMSQFPKQSTVKPWRLYQNYVLDYLALKWGSIEDSAMQFARRPTRPRTTATSQQTKALAQTNVRDAA